MSKVTVKGSSTITINGVNYYGGQEVELTSEQIENVKEDVITSNPIFNKKIKLKPSNTREDS